MQVLQIIGISITCQIGVRKIQKLHALDYSFKIPRTVEKSTYHVGSAHKWCPIVELVRNIKCKDDRESKICQEESLSSGICVLSSISDWPGSSPELRNEHEDVKDEAKPRTVQTSLRFKGKLVKAVTLLLPGRSEADVGQADGTPRENGGESRERVKPVKRSGCGLLATTHHVTEQPEDRCNNNGPQRSSFPVYICEEPGGLALIGECGEGAR